MKVLLVCNNVYMRGNGVCTAMLSLIRRLKERGVDVRLMSCKNPNPDGEQPYYPLEHFKFPVFEPIISSNGFRFATFSKEVAIRAIQWADVVHLCEGFPMQAMTASLARKMGKPCVGTYHFFAENITGNVGLRKVPLLNHLITLWWRKSVYDHCTHVQCPTPTVKRYLQDNDFQSELRVVTNGMDIVQPLPVASQPQTDIIQVLCIGRLAGEKSQDTLLDAMKYSKHAHRIQLHFAGKGPFKEKFEKMATKLYRNGTLSYMPKFAFYDPATLKQLIRRSYLYIHCAWVEVEGLSCAEAIMEGVVPVIADGPLSATSQFALDERSLYPVFDARALAERIDWWIDHPAERAAMGPKYVESIKKYDAKESTDQIIQIYQDSISVCSTVSSSL